MKCAKCGKRGPVRAISELCPECYSEWLRLRNYVMRLFLKGEYLPVRDKP